MKTLIYTLALSLTFCFVTQAQSQTEDANTFTKNGKWLVETSYNSFSLTGNGGTGSNAFVDFDGNNFSSFGAEIGKFVIENLAVKFKFSTSNVGDITLTSYGTGLKYYIAGKVPVDFGLGVLTGVGGPGESTFLGNVRTGYAFYLADNITFEPTCGLIVTNEEALLSFSLGFSMFL